MEGDMQEGMEQEQGNTCQMCGHVHTKEDGTCDCGCGTH